MSREQAISLIEQACSNLQAAEEILNSMGCTYSVSEHIQHTRRRLLYFISDVYSINLLSERKVNDNF